MVIARALVQALRDAGHRRRHRRHAAEPLRPAGLGLPRHLADRRRVDRRRADRPGDQPALSELRGAASAARVLAEPHDARVLRPVGPVQRRRWGRPALARSGCAARADPRRRSLPADAQRLPAVRPVADHPAAAGDVAGAALDGAVSAGAAAAVPLRRVRRLRVHGVAADAAEARRPADRGAGAARGAPGSARSSPATAKSAIGCRRSSRGSASRTA